MKSLSVFTILISALLPLSASAQFGEVSINGEPVDPEMFIAFKSQGISGKQFCYPNTDQFVVTTVVERLLIIEAGRAAGFDATLRLEVPPKPDSETSDDLYYRHVFLSNTLRSESSDYVKPLIGDAASYTIDQAKQLYINRLEANDPLVVNVTLVRAAQLHFKTFIEADEVMERLLAGKTIDEIAGDLGFSNNIYLEEKSVWKHIAKLPKLDGGDAPVVGSLFGPFSNRVQWSVGQVLETKKSPVMLLNDRMGSGYSRLSSDLRDKFDRDNYNALVMDLWAKADIELDGKSLKHPGDDYCNTPIL